ncbi:LOW QUALITY PROTEIN: tubulin--tyrosine ligase-like protein 12 [Herrania umbratica]|uniref:LOW QUALITY PROTEIN: tubulin--tyrosine ligase-like protein 12 n=1 Tax=Herrania umbratica TaxID=108875 RepID=A0A6J0ZNM8_9ROSI|nr:LOW QUALITY PROTEIN: tubulin--tyrosine ligase-like protein 12 [Herrania umbratica]
MSATTTSTGGRIETYEDFVKVHGLLLAASGLPQSLHRKLFEKLSSETFDGGAHFEIELCEDGRQRRLLLTSDTMPKDSNAFLIDHAWTFRLPDACKQLQEVPGLAQRMAALMCLDVDDDAGLEEAVENGGKMTAEEVLESETQNAKANGDGVVRWLELEEVEIDDNTFLSLDLSTKFPDLMALSLCGNKLKNTEKLVQEVTKFKNLKALWLNNNPVLEKSDGGMEDAILRGCPKLEIYNSRFTRNFGSWALGFCADVYGKDNPGSSHQGDLALQSVTSLDVSNRCIHNLINKAFSPFEMPNLSHLNIRGNPIEENSISDLFGILKAFYCLQSLEVDIPGPLGESAVEILESLPTLSSLNGVDASKILESEKHVVDSMLQPRLPEWSAEEPLADCVLNAMWLYLMTYRLADEEKLDETPVWYVVDELGSALRHSDEPNFRVAPFLFMPEGNLASAVSYSILWPTQNVKKGEECTRDYLFGIGEEKQRSARLTAWFYTPQNYFIQEYKKHHNKLQSRSLPSVPIKSSSISGVHCSDGSVLRVYTDMPQVEEFLTRPEFVITNEPKDADIIWTSMQVDEEMKKVVGITDQQYVNQFPFEACLVMKHHLADTIQKAQGSPGWLQPTYNLETHLSQLIGDYCLRKRDGLNNLWILKPWNMARTIDTTVTDNLSAIIRLMETGPKICQKYIEHPALFQGKKFDLRYIILVRSITPLDIFLSDVFWVRLANNPYTLEKHSLFEYETHFTVMNYGRKLNHMNTPEFVREFEKEHQVKWLDIHQRVKTMIRSVFESAAAVHPEMHDPKSRAMYGVDVMLDGSFQPKLLEVTYCPDCMRACKYDTEAISGGGEVIRGRDFFNFVFGCLFLNENVHVSQL